MQYEITVHNLGTKWAQVTIHYNTGRDSNAKIAVQAVADIPVQQRVTVRGYIDLHETKYGLDPELILITEEEEAAGNAERKRSEITRWLGYFDEKAKTGYYYGRAVSEIQGLGCHDYDTHFHESWILMWSKIQEKSWSERPLMGGKSQKDTFDMYIGALLC